MYFTHYCAFQVSVFLVSKDVKSSWHSQYPPWYYQGTGLKELEYLKQAFGIISPYFLSTKKFLQFYFHQLTYIHI